MAKRGPKAKVKSGSKAGHPKSDSGVEAGSSLSSEGGWQVRLIESAPDLVCLCRKGLIAYINPAGVRKLRLASAKRAVGQPFHDFVHPDYAKVADDLLKCLVEEQGTHPLKLLPRKGASIDVEVLVTAADDSNSEMVIVQAHDITERLRSAKAILRSETRYRQLVENALDLICVCNDGRITFINSAGARILGAKDPEQVIGKPLAKLVHPDYRELLTQGVDSLNEEGTAVPLKLLRLDREVIDVEVAVTPFGSASEASFMMEAHDITQRKRAEEELRKTHEELELRVEERTRELTQEIGERRLAEDKLRLAGKVIENLSEAVVIVDTDFKATTINPAYSEITGYAKKDVIGKLPSFHADICKDDALLAQMRKDIEKKGRWEGEFWSKRKNGEDYANHLSVTAITDENGEINRYAVLISDITERKRAEKRIHYQANYDALTGLPNRALFLDRLGQALPSMTRTNKKLGLLFIDLDGFKTINDTHGHDIGDLLLKEVSERLMDCVRKGDTVARLGSDEFTIIMPNLTDPRHAPLIGQRALDTLSEPFNLKGDETFISGSIGIAIFPDDATDTNGLIKNADAAMYRAKERGKANYQFFTDDLNEEVRERLILKNGLNKALKSGEFHLLYQPKVEIESGHITGVEALMRWNSPSLGLVSPVRFIPILEETGQVVEVGEWAIMTACKQHLEWCKAGLPPLRIAVNLSARQLRDTSFVSAVERILKETGIGPSALEIEITESMLMSDSENVVNSLGQLHDMGIHIAMDDFGTGYSSLSYLKRFPIDTIKIDQSFVADITTSTDDAEIIKTIISMGQTLNRKVVAEGVETKEQLSMLGDYHCDEIQGYFISRPLPAEQLTKFHRKNYKS